MTNIAYQGLSGSTNGKSVQVTGTNDAGSVTVHTAVAGTSSWDAVFVDAFNTSVNDVLLTIEFGSNGAKDLVSVIVPAQSGAFQVIPGWALQNGQVVKAYAATANVISLAGYVHRMT